MLDIYYKLPIQNEIKQQHEAKNFEVAKEFEVDHHSGNYSNAEEIYTINKLGENNFEIVMGKSETLEDVSSHFNSSSNNNNKNNNNNNKNNNNKQLVSIGQELSSDGVDEEMLIERSLNAVNNDPNPIVIRRKNEENIEYKQNVFIRWLQPPTPPPPAPIISKEITNSCRYSILSLILYGLS